ncbi:MAG: hypothetical protein R3D83_03925 [Caenibius sp.]
MLGATLPADNSRPKIEDMVTAFDRLVVSQESAVHAASMKSGPGSRAASPGFPLSLRDCAIALRGLSMARSLRGISWAVLQAGFYLTSGVQEGAAA